MVYRQDRRVQDRRGVSRPSQSINSPPNLTSSFRSRGRLEVARFGAPVPGYCTQLGISRCPFVLLLSPWSPRLLAPATAQRDLMFPKADWSTSHVSAPGLEISVRAPRKFVGHRPRGYEPFAWAIQRLSRTQGDARRCLI